MTFTVRPLPCHCCISALCLHGTNLTQLHACVKAKGSYFEHNLPQKAPNWLWLTCICCVCVHLRLFFVCCKLPFVSVNCPSNVR